MKAIISGDVRGLSSPICHVKLVSIFRAGVFILYILEGRVQCSLCGGASLYPWFLSQVSVPVLGGWPPFPLT